MNQQRVWQHYQNEAPEIFSQADGRIRFLSRRLRQRVGAGARVLNVGLGDGLFEELALQLGMDIHTLDPDERAIERLNKQPGMEGRAQAGMLEAVPFEEERFDAVVLSEVLEHLSDDSLELALHEILRVLRPGGIVIGTVPANEKLSEQLTVCPNCDEKFHRWGHLQSFDEGRIRTLLSKHFRVEAVQVKLLPPWVHLDWRGRTISLFKNALHRLGFSWPGASLYFAAVKDAGSREARG